MTHLRGDKTNYEKQLQYIYTKRRAKIAIIKIFFSYVRPPKNQFGQFKTI